MTNKQWCEMLNSSTLAWHPLFPLQIESAAQHLVEESVTDP